MGNRVSSDINGFITQYSYDDNDRLLQDGGNIYTYDENGNTLTQTIDYNTTTSIYNAKNHLIEVQTDRGITTYRYNINGIRVSKTTPNDNIAYLIDSNRPYSQVIQEITDGSLAVSYTYGHDLLSQNRDNKIYDYHYDGLGSARFLSDESGAFTDSYNYEAFGKLINKEGNTSNNYLYTGEQYDAETQNYYLRARYFSPTTGRFTQQDTYMGNNQDPLTLHKYLYANANPSNMIDPSGNVSMLSLTATIAMDSILMGVRAYGIYETASDVYNGNWDSLVQDMVLNMVGSKFVGDILSQSKFMQNMGKKFQSIIDKLRCIFNSFDGTTLVATENGLIPIAEIKIGDKVWAYNEANQSKSLQEVTHLIRGEGDKELVDITLTSGEVITATSNHPFWAVADQNWTDAGKLTADSILLNINEKNSTISSVRDYTLNTTVYNLTVANDHTYFVGLGGVLGHNSGCKLVKVNKPDPDADALAERIGGESRVRFVDDPIEREFDVISDKYLGQAKPANHKFGSKERNQAKATFEVAKEKGLEVYYHFDGSPDPSVIRKLNEYSQRYNIPLTIDIDPF